MKKICNVDLNANVPNAMSIGFKSHFGLSQFLFFKIYSHICIFIKLVPLKYHTFKNSNKMFLFQFCHDLIGSVFFLLSIFSIIRFLLILSKLI